MTKERNTKQTYILELNSVRFINYFNNAFVISLKKKKENSINRFMKKIVYYVLNYVKININNKIKKKKEKEKLYCFKEQGTNKKRKFWLDEK